MNLNDKTSLINDVAILAHRNVIRGGGGTEIQRLQHQAFHTTIQILYYLQ